MILFDEHQKIKSLLIAAGPCVIADKLKDKSVSDAIRDQGKFTDEDIKEIKDAWIKRFSRRCDHE